MRRIIILFKELPEFVWQSVLGSIRNNDSKIATFLRSKIYKTDCRLDINVIIKNRDNFKSGLNSVLYNSCYIMNTNGQFIIGNNSHLGAFCFVNVCYGKITIGNNVAIGPGTKIFAYSNHYRQGKNVTEEYITSNVSIGNNVFIGANCSILPGTRINDNIVIGAGSVVKGELDSNSIYAGSPSKKIKDSWFL